MLGRSGWFKDISCPFYETGLCERPYCHFKHERPPVAPPAASVSPVLDSNPVPTVSQVNSTQFVGYVGYVDSGGPHTDIQYTPSPRNNTEIGVRRSKPLLDTVITPAPQPEVKKKAKKSLPAKRPASPAHVTGLNELASDLADIDRQIALLQTQIENEKHKKPSSSGGYTPTPISELKGRQNKQTHSVQKNNHKDLDKTAKKGLKTARKEPEPTIPKLPFLSTEDILGRDPTPTDAPPRPKKAKTSKTEEKATKSTEKKHVSPTPSSNDETTENAKVEKPIPPVPAVSPIKHKPKIDPSALEVTSYKQRTANSNSTHDPAQLRQKVSTSKVHLPTPKQQLTMRFSELRKAKQDLLADAAAARYGKKKNPEKITENELMQNSHREGAIAATVPKGEKRMAHKPKLVQQPESDPLPGKPIIPLDLSAKIPTNMRQRYLDLFIFECLKFCANREEAYSAAQSEEVSLVNRATTKGGYMSAAVQTLKRLRERALPDVNPKPAPSSAISHDAVIGGKGAVQHSFTLRRTGGTQQREGAIDERWLYENLDSFVLTTEQLNENGFPRPDPVKSNCAIFRKEEVTKKLIDDEVLTRICCRCGKEYRLTDEGEYVNVEECVYHYGKAWKTKVVGKFWDNRFSCCDSDLSSRGCAIASNHVTETIRRSTLNDFVQTQPCPDPDRPPKVYAVDCEMVYSVWGSSLARISMVDCRLQTVMDIVVKPTERVIDCNTRFSGLTIEMLNKSEHDLHSARNELLRLVHSNTILVGHSLESDLKAMRIMHDKVVDTSVMFPHKRGPPYKRGLRMLMQEYCKKIIQQDVGGHDSSEDASACMELILWKVKEDMKLT